MNSLDDFSKGVGFDEKLILAYLSILEVVKEA